MISTVRTLIAPIFWLAMALTPTAARAIASTQIADLGVTFTVKPGTFLPPNSIGTVTVTVTNNGPDPVPAFVVHSSIWEDGKQILLFATPETQCDFGYGYYDGPTLLVFAALGFQSSLPAGAQESCTLGISTYPQATGQYEMYFNVAAYAGGPTDPNTANNQSSSVTLFLSPMSVPALNAFGLLLAMLSMVLVAALRLKRPQWGTLQIIPFGGSLGISLRPNSKRSPSSGSLRTPLLRLATTRRSYSQKERSDRGPRRSSRFGGPDLVSR